MSALFFILFFSNFIPSYKQPVSPKSSVLDLRSHCLETGNLRLETGNWRLEIANLTSKLLTSSS